MKYITDDKPNIRDGVTCVRFTNFSRDIEPGYIPDSVTCIHFDTIDFDILPGSIPEFVSSISIQNITKSQHPHILPAKLDQLTIKISPITQNIVFPDSITRLNLSGDMRCLVQPLPPNLTYIRFTDISGPLSIDTLPNTISKIALWHNASINGNTLPSQLDTIDVFCDIQKSFPDIKVFNGVTTLRIYEPEHIHPHMFPDLTKLILGSEIFDIEFISDLPYDVEIRWDLEGGCTYMPRKMDFTKLKHKLHIRSLEPFDIRDRDYLDIIHTEDKYHYKYEVTNPGNRPSSLEA